VHTVPGFTECDKSDCSLNISKKYHMFRIQSIGVSKSVSQSVSVLSVTYLVLFWSTGLNDLIDGFT
jgi:hypothetical protein